MSANKSSDNNLIDDDTKNNLTQEQVLIVAKKVTGDAEVKVIDYGFKDYSALKMGYLGSHRNLNIVVKVNCAGISVTQALLSSMAIKIEKNKVVSLRKISVANKKGSKESETLTVFVKSIPYDNDFQADFLRTEGIFVKESSFYDKVFPWITKDYEGEKWSANCYLVTNDAMIMEDLRAQGYKVISKLADDLIDLKSALAALARFHSCSILTEARLSQESKKSTLNEYYPEVIKEICFNREGKCARWSHAGSKLGVQLAERLGYESTSISRSFDNMFEIVKPSKKHHNVIGHGDLWANNMMFDDSKPLRKCVLVDFQIIRYGPLVLDLLQLLYVNSTREFRKKNENELLKFYHSILEESIKSNDPTGNAKIPKVKDIIDEYEDLRIFGATLACLYFPIVFLDPQILADHTSNAEDYENFIFGDRLNITLESMEKDENYRNRVEEAINELVEVNKRS